MATIEQKVRSIKEDQRADWLWPTKIAAQAAECHPRKFGEWWRRNKHKLKRLYIYLPGETAAELMGVIAEGEAERQKLLEQQRTSESRLHP